MTTPQDPQQYIHRAAVDAEGNRIGKISQVYLDDKTGQPLWVLVETGLFGTRQSFAPIHGSRFEGELVALAVSKDQVKDAPNIEGDAHLSDSEQGALRQYYSDYLGTVAQAGGYGEGGQASKLDSGQEPSFRRTET
jgi:PRC-barrel domain